MPICKKLLLYKNYNYKNSIHILLKLSARSPKCQKREIKAERVERVDRVHTFLLELRIQNIISAIIPHILQDRLEIFTM